MPAMNDFSNLITTHPPFLSPDFHRPFLSADDIPEMKRSLLTALSVIKFVLERHEIWSGALTEVNKLFFLFTAAITKSVAHLPTMGRISVACAVPVAQTSFDFHDFCGKIPSDNE